MQALPDRDRRYLRGPRCSLPTPARDINVSYDNEAARADTERAARFTPTPRDVERCLTVLSWLHWLEAQGENGQRGVRIIFARAFGRPFWKIAAKLEKRRSDETVRRWEATAIEAIALRFRAEIEAMK